jgi:hypothetical protein
MLRSDSLTESLERIKRLEIDWPSWLKYERTKRLAKRQASLSPKSSLFLSVSFVD